MNFRIIKVKCIHFRLALDCDFSIKSGTKIYLALDLAPKAYLRTKFSTSGTKFPLLMIDANS